MAVDIAPLYDDLTFLAPLSDERADRLVEFVAAELTGTVVDVGCGWAEFLLRVLEAAPAAKGFGVDLDPRSIDHGRELAVERGLAERVVLEVGDARELLPDQVAAAICIGASHAWGPAVEDNEPLDYRAALKALRAALPVGGRLVYGECIWSQPPTDAATAPLAGRADEFVSLPELVDIATDEAFRPIEVSEATLDEWDLFEAGNAAGYSTWLAEHPADHPDAARVREIADHHSTAYLHGYRGILGMGYLGLVAVD